MRVWHMGTWDGMVTADTAGPLAWKPASGAYPVICDANRSPISVADKSGPGKRYDV